MKKILLLSVLVLFGCDNTSIVSFKDKVSFKTEMAITHSQHEKGLMFRKKLCEKCGMLFDFKEERQIGMWMKDTEISLDMLFLNAKQKVVYIAEKTTPFSLEKIMTTLPVRYVLEIPAGIAQKYNLKIGDKMEISK